MDLKSNGMDVCLKLIDLTKFKPQTAKLKFL